VGKTIERKSKVIFGLLCAAVFIMAFQNCAIPIDFSKLESKANGNGSGYDGKTYVNHGTCSDPLKLEVKGSIEVLADGTASVTREDCSDLAQPLPIAAGSLQAALSDPNVLVFEKNIYDLRTGNPATQKLTRLLCWTHPPLGSNRTETYELTAWYMGDALVVNAQRPTLSSVLVTSGGDTTGVFATTTETYLSPNNVTYSARSTGNLFDLTLYAGTVMNYGTMQSKINGVAQTTMSTQECYLQAPTFP
jgi:hypothetical protein